VAALSSDNEQQLSWERRQRPRAAIAALLAAVGLLSSYIISQELVRGAPKASFVESLQRALEPGRLATRPSLQIPGFEFANGRVTALIIYGVVGCLATIATGLTIAFLGVATRARRKELGAWAIHLAIGGGVLKGLSLLVGALEQRATVRDFLAGPRTVADASIGLDALAYVVGVAQFLGTFALAGGFVLVSLNAMRAGLLTRFFGILGVISGVLVIVPLGGPVIESVFLGSLAVAFFGFWPNGIPPAWVTGNAEPWPARATPQPRAPRASRGAPAPAGTPEPAGTPATPRPAASAKRKRKRRS
jgi:hypothetical protein